MNIVFLTNFLTHHQTPFCDAMYSQLQDEFHLIVMRPTDPEQKNLGYKNLNNLYPFVVKAYEGTQEEAFAMSLCEHADVVILGSAPQKYIQKRLKQNKVTLIYTERIFKKGIKYAFYPPVILQMLKRFTFNRQKKQYYLCAGGYVAKDINLFTHTREKFFKWGYFPETKTYENVDLLIDQKEKNSIVWVARYIDWKHPEIPLEIGKRLLRDGYDFKINMIGNGVMLEKIALSVQEQGLGENVNILGAIESDKVREHMEKAEIHLFTSDRQEGWGAVLNESMNSACAVVANKEIGAVPFLLQNGSNGFVCETTDELYEKIKFLLDNPQERKKLSRAAYRTISEEWNESVATQRLLALCSALLDEKKVKYAQGPCSNSFVN